MKGNTRAKIATAIINHKNVIAIDSRNTDYFEVSCDLMNKSDMDSFYEEIRKLAIYYSESIRIRMVQSMSHAIVSDDLTYTSSGVLHKRGPNKIMSEDAVNFDFIAELRAL